jgi:hypothetical protein
MWQRANALNLLVVSIATLIVFVAVSVTHLPTSPPQNDLSGDLETVTNELVLEEATGTTKDLWVNKSGKRLHYHLESPTTKIIMKHDHDKYAFFEEMDDMRLWMQDRFLTSSSRPTQQVRFIQSPHSTFDFSLQKLCTENTFIALYTTPGEELSLYLKPEQISMRGKAEAFDVTMEKDGANFTAKGFTAQINESGDLR